MATKREKLEKVPFRFLKEFTIHSEILRERGGYYNKEDHVDGLVRNLQNQEVDFLMRCLEREYTGKETADKFLRELRPNEDIVRAEFLDHLRKSGNPKEEAIFCEFPLEGNRSDINRFNGSSFTYELKSPRDSFRRVTEQLNTYSEIFEYSYLVVPIEFEIPENIPKSVGIIRYSYPEFEFQVEEEPTQESDLSPQKQMRLLWLEELREIIGIEISGEKRGTKKDRMVEEIKSEYSDWEINQIFKQRIKARHGIPN